MDAIAILLDKLRSIERFYSSAAGVFIETKRKITSGEPPYEPPPFDPETDTDFEPPFTTAWIEADDFQNVVGQACITLIK